MNTVTVRDLVLGEGLPKICVPIVAHTYAELEAALDEIDPDACDLVEFRADFYFEEDFPALERIREKIGNRPLLYTIRTKEEGGEIDLSQEAYEARTLAAAEWIDLADIQLGRIHFAASRSAVHSSVVHRLHEKGVKVVGSWHDFDRTPPTEKLILAVKQMQEEGCDICKIAVMPENRQDVIRLIRASLQLQEQEADRPFITLSMGNLGRITRAAGNFTGSCITYGMAGKQSAPGQINAGLLRDILRALS